MVEVVLLGTGTPIPDPQRCGSGSAVSVENEWVLVDCGRGVTQRGIEAGLDLRTLKAVLLTHHHSDHISDLPTLAMARWTMGATTPLDVITPAGPCARYAGSCLEVFEDQTFYSQARPESGHRPEIKVRSFYPTASPTHVVEVGPFAITSALVDHHPIESAVGYRITVSDRVITFSGDTAVCPGIRLLAQDADLLIHESLNPDLVGPTILEWNAGADAVGELSATSGVKQLVLTHLLPPPGSVTEEQAFADHARAGGFQGSIHVARDLMRLTVPIP